MVQIAAKMIIEQIFIATTTDKTRIARRRRWRIRHKRRACDLYYADSETRTNKSRTKSGTKSGPKTPTKSGTTSGTKSGPKTPTKSGTKTPTKSDTKSRTISGTKRGTKIEKLCDPYRAP